MVIKIYVNAYRAELKLKRLMQKVKDAAELSGKEIGDLGKTYARSIAPVRSGELISLIKLFKQDGNKYIIRSLNPKSSLERGDRNRGFYGGPVPFNLVQWMHLTGGKWHKGPFAGQQADFSGKNPRYMYKTRDYLSRVAGQKARQTFNKIKIT